MNAPRKRRRAEATPNPPPIIEELSQLGDLRHPRQVQDLLDSLAYSSDDCVRCPKDALIAKKAHCFCGALIAAVALTKMHEKWPSVVSKRPALVFLDAERDDGHMLAVFQSHGRFGAVSKSNFVGLRYRDPVYTSLRELVMSYFDDYYNMQGEKTLRRYSVPVYLSRFNRIPWTTDASAVSVIEQAVYSAATFELLPRRKALLDACLSRVDQRCFDGGLVGTKMAGMDTAGHRDNE
jgi:hypothetical protein